LLRYLLGTAVSPILYLVAFGTAMGADARFDGHTYLEFLLPGPWFWLAVVLNAFVFASLAVLFAMIVTGHGDQAMLTAFVITPMAFLGGTFFPLDRLPEWAQAALYLLPLTHAAQAMRADVFGQTPQIMHFVVLAGVGAAVFCLALVSVGRARD
jgi:ABC-type multidrug transport system permease subunit